MTGSIVTIEIKGSISPGGEGVIVTMEVKGSIVTMEMKGSISPWR